MQNRFAALIVVCLVAVLSLVITGSAAADTSYIRNYDCEIEGTITTPPSDGGQQSLGGQVVCAVQGVLGPNLVEATHLVTGSIGLAGERRCTVGQGGFGHLNSRQANLLGYMPMSDGSTVYVMGGAAPFAASVDTVGALQMWVYVYGPDYWYAQTSGLDYLVFGDRTIVDDRNATRLPCEAGSRNFVAEMEFTLEKRG